MTAIAYHVFPTARGSYMPYLSANCLLSSYLSSKNRLRWQITAVKQTMTQRTVHHTHHPTKAENTRTHDNMNILITDRCVRVPAAGY